MTTTLDYLSDLREKGIVISLAPDGDQLKVSAPKGAMDDTVKSELSSRKDEILGFLQGAVASQERTLPDIERRSEDQPPRLSAAQDRVWRLHRLAPDASALNIAVPWRVRGPLDVDVLNRSLEQLALRHETLRCRFAAEDGEAIVVVGDTGGLAIEHLDPSADAEAGEDPFEAAFAAATDFANRPFDLVRQVARVALIPVGEQDHILVMVFHQIVFDWGAANPLIADLAAIYRSLSGGTDTSLEELSVGYLDYAQWQNEWLAGGNLDRQKQAWAETLEAPYQPLPLPTRTGDEPTDTDVLNRLYYDLSAADTDRLKDLSQGTGATLYMTLLGAWQALLAGYGDRDDCIVFSLLGLNRPELKKLIGLFANPLPVRIDLSGDPTPTALVERVRTAALGAYSNQDLPLETVLQQLRVDGGGQSGPFQSLFIYQHEPAPQLVLGAAEAELLTVGDHAPAFDLRLFAEDTEDGIRGWLEYNQDVFDHGTVQRMLSQYVDVLGAILDRGEQPISTLLPITDEDRAAAALAEESRPTATAVAYVAPTNETEQRLADIWGEQFGRQVGIDDDFFALGGHSLMAISMFAEVESTWGRSLPLATLFQAPNIRALAAVVKQEDFQLEWTSLVPIKPTGTKRPIFCISALGDEIVQFGELAELLSEDQPFYGLQQGLDRADEIRTTIPDIAAHYLDEVRTVQPTGPYVIAGYCFGGLVAYEMAQQLKANGESVAPLLMVEAEAPGAIRPIQYTTGQKMKRATMLARRRGIVSLLKYARKRAMWMWRWVLWTRIRHYLHRGFDKMKVELPDTLKDILQINAQAADDYAPVMQPYDGDVYILRAEEMAPDYIYDDLLGWDKLVTGDIQSYWLPGGHEGIWKTPNVQEFAKRLEGVIEEVGNSLPATTSS